MAYTVEQHAASDSIGETLAELWHRNLELRGEPRHKFSWFYQRNPAGAATAFILKHARDSNPGIIVGACGLGTRSVLVNGKPVVAGLLADFSVDREHRTVMPALLLQRALCAEALSRFPVAYAYPNASAVGIFSRIGFRPLGRMRRFVKVLRYRPYLRSRTPPFIANLAAVPLDVFGSAIDLTRAARYRTAGWRLEWCQDVDERFDRLWARVQSGYPFIGVRDAEFLRWRFVTRPERQAAFAILVNSEGELEAYGAIIQKEPEVAFIADFLGSSERALRLLFTQVIRQLRAQPFHAVTTTFMGSTSIAGALTAAGFQPRGEPKFVVLGGSPTWDGHEHLPANESQAYLTEADRDN